MVFIPKDWPVHGISFGLIFDSPAVYEFVTVHPPVILKAQQNVVLKFAGDWRNDNEILEAAVVFRTIG